jgi:putative NIF3 family GTP cyclohydrolase 1 type 2
MEKIEPIIIELENFLPKKLALSFQKYGFQIRDLGSKFLAVAFDVLRKAVSFIP